MTTTAATHTKPKPAPPLRVVVVDDHHHVLPEIHLALRRRVLPFAGVHVVHWDAHPDLSFPSAVDAALVFEPERLYDALDASPAGIAEFLLPLAFAGHVDRVTWVKPPWAAQMRAGDAMERIAIGRSATTSRLAVACPWVHFIDDDLYAPEATLDASTVKRWDLAVTEDPTSVLPALTSPWVLDVDLDYFSTWNPFRKDLEKLVAPAALEVLTRVFTRSRFKRPEASLLPDARVRERQQFLDTMDRVQQLAPFQLHVHAVALVASLVPFYEDSDIEASLHAFLELLASSDDATRAGIWHAAPCLDLPHHESSLEEIETLLATFQAFLQSAKQTNHAPALVTIATSVSDNFLPPPQLALIKTRVLEIVEATLGPVQVDEIEYEDTPAE